MADDKSMAVTLWEVLHAGALVVIVGSDGRLSIDFVRPRSFHARLLESGGMPTYMSDESTVRDIVLRRLERATRVEARHSSIGDECIRVSVRGGPGAWNAFYSI
jgi:hypothetical protein